MTFEQRPEYIKGVSHANIWRHNIDGRGNSKSKDPEVGTFLPSSRSKQGSLCGCSAVKHEETVGD